VVKSNVAIVGPRVRFSAGALFTLSAHFLSSTIPKYTYKEVFTVTLNRGYIPLALYFTTKTQTFGLLLVLLAGLLVRFSVWSLIRHAAWYSLNTNIVIFCRISVIKQPKLTKTHLDHHE
jgi:hypothetical protein